jgi:hypothetical protein
MSAELYRTRLFFEARSRSGIAKSEGVTVALFQLPDIPALPKHVVEIDYAPQVRVAELRESANARRDMTREEIEAVAQWLASLVAAVQLLMGPIE